MSLSAAYVTSRSIGPFGYTSGRSNGHYQAVLPTSKSSMHLNLHKNVPNRIRPHSVLDNSKGILAGLKLLDKQRPKMKRFVGIKFSVKPGEQEKLTSRLATYNPLRFPAESKGLLPPIDNLELSDRSKKTYTEDQVRRLIQSASEKQSLTAEEVQAIVDRLTAKPADRSRTDEKGGAGVKRYSAAQVKAVVERLANYDPESWPADSRGTVARERDLSDLLKPGPSASSSEVKAIVERLSQYDPKKWPPGSKMSEEEKKSAGKKGKKVSEEELDQIVSRLTTFDKKKWPPESVGMKEEFYQGKPLVFKN